MRRLAILKRTLLLGVVLSYLALIVLALACLSFTAAACGGIVELILLLVVLISQRFFKLPSLTQAARALDERLQSKDRIASFVALKHDPRFAHEPRAEEKMQLIESQLGRRFESLELHNLLPWQLGRGLRRGLYTLPLVYLLAGIALWRLWPAALEDPEARAIAKVVADNPMLPKALQDELQNLAGELNSHGLTSAEVSEALARAKAEAMRAEGEIAESTAGAAAALDGAPDTPTPTPSASPEATETPSPEPSVSPSPSEQQSQTEKQQQDDKQQSDKKEQSEHGKQGQKGQSQKDQAKDQQNNGKRGEGKGEGKEGGAKDQAGQAGGQQAGQGNSAGKDDKQGAGQGTGKDEQDQKQGPGEKKQQAQAGAGKQGEEQKRQSGEQQVANVQQALSDLGSKIDKERSQKEGGKEGGESGNKMDNKQPGNKDESKDGKQKGQAKEKDGEKDDKQSGKRKSPESEQGGEQGDSDKDKAARDQEGQAPSASKTQGRLAKDGKPSGLEGEKGFEDVKLPGQDEKYDPRFISNDTSLQKGKDGAKYKVELKDLQFAKPEPAKEKGSQPIPLEYKDMLE